MLAVLLLPTLLATTVPVVISDSVNVSAIATTAKAAIVGLNVQTPAVLHIEISDASGHVHRLGALGIEGHEPIGKWTIVFLHAPTSVMQLLQLPGARVDVTRNDGGPIIANHVEILEMHP